MKLKREQFNPLRLPMKGKGGKSSGGGTDLEPLDDDDTESDDVDDDEDEVDDSDDDDGEEGDAGTMLTPEESEEIQRKIGVHVELPGEGDDEKDAQTAARYVDKLASNRGGIGGSGDGNLRRAILRLVQPQVDWKTELKRYIGKMMSSSELYLGSRRHLHSGDYFYGEKHKYDALHRIAIAVDVTGSVQGDFAEFISEVAGVAHAKKIKEIHVLPFAETVHDVVVLKGKPPKPEDFKDVSLGGGTENIVAIKDYIKNTLYDDIAFCLIITDGHLTSGLPIAPKAAWGKNTIWLVYNNSSFTVDYPFSSAWGRVLNVKFKKK